MNELPLYYFAHAQKLEKPREGGFGGGRRCVRRVYIFEVPCRHRFIMARRRA